MGIEDLARDQAERYVAQARERLGQYLTAKRSETTSPVESLVFDVAKDLASAVEKLIHPEICLAFSLRWMRRR